MKARHIFGRFSALAMILVMLLACAVIFVACNSSAGNGDDTTAPNTDADTTAADEQTEEETTAEPAPSPISLIVNGASEYVVVVPEGRSEEIATAAKTLISAIANKTGVTLTLKTDFVKPSLGLVEAPCEILIGDCDRDTLRAAKATIRYNDFLIAVYDQKLIILGGNDEKTVSAVSCFINQVMTASMVYQGGELYREEASYRVDQLTINGHDITEYRIVYDASKSSIYKTAATDLQSMIQEMCGYTLEIGTTRDEETACEFLFGNCGREGMSTLVVEDKLSYAFEAKSTDSTSKIAILADGALSTSKGVDVWFNKTFVASATDKVDLKIENETYVEAFRFGYDLADGATMRIMSNNILSDSTLSSRAALLVELYMEYFPDVIGLQECGSAGHTGVVKKLSDFYGAACTTIDGTDGTSCYTPILYRKDLYELVDSKAVFLNSRWPKTNTKTVSYAVLKNKQTGEQFIIINSHFAIITDSYDTESYYGEKYTNGVQGVQWRNDNARQVAEMVKNFQKRYGDDCAIFFMGDLNCNATSEAHVTLNSVMKNCQDLAKYGASFGYASWHSVGKLPTVNGLAIDHIFVTSSIEVYKHVIPFTDQRVLDSADHCPVICDVSLK